MAFGERVPKEFGAPTATDLATATNRAVEAVARARRRFEMAKLIASVPGSLRVKRNAVVHAINQRTLPAGCSPPSRSTVSEFQARWENGEQTLEDYMDKPRSGRPRKILRAAVEKTIQLEILLGAPTAADVQFAANGAREGTNGGVNYSQAHRRYAEAGRFARTAYRHGSRAALVHATPHGRYVTQSTHEVWAIDELTLPVYHRHLDNVTGEWVSVRADIVLIVDVRSSAVVGYHLADPTRTRAAGEETTQQGFAKSDVMAALVTAACPELAPDSTRDFAGFVPEKIRWDNAKAHIGIERWFKSAGVGIDSVRIPKRWANRNGGAERRVQIVKRWCRGILGHVDEYLPLDRAPEASSEDLGRERSLAAGSRNEVQPRLIPIDPADLHDLEGLRRVFDGVVYRYNHEHVNSATQRRAAIAYKEHLEPKRPHNGHHLLLNLDPTTVRVGGGAIRHYVDGRTVEFNAIVGGIMFMVDEPVTFRADPLGRAIFVEVNRKLHVLKPALAATDPDLARRMAQSTGAVARRLSDQAQAAREADADTKIEKARNRKPAERPADQASSGGVPPVTLPEPIHRPGQPKNNPWSSGDFTQFLRPRQDGENPEEA